MATSWMIFSGFLGALSNLCMRRSMDRKGTAKAFFIFQLFFTCLVSILLYPVRTDCYTCNLQILIMGFLTGISLGSMKWMLGKALQKGPPGLTFATVNSATVMPAIVIVLITGSLIDLKLSIYDFIGSLLVIIGLFWAGWNKSEKIETRAWILFAALAFSAHVFYLILTEYRTLIMGNHFPVMNHWLIHPANMASDWFVPTVFATACGMHTMMYISSEKRIPSQDEIIWGTAGGILNGLCTFLYIYALEIATLKETSYIFSVFSISLIVVCNLWGQWFYDEHVNWTANAICLLGIFIASLT